MMAYAGSGRCGVLDKVAMLSCDCTRLVSCICSKIQCPNADSVRFWIDSHNMQLGCNKIRSELTIIYRGTLAYCRAEGCGELVLAVFFDGDYCVKFGSVAVGYYTY